jgi:TolB-like protein
MTLPGGTRLGPYEILAPIGAGGMGEVYRARDGKLNREVAIKVLPEAFAADAERLARFRREAQVLAALNHPHIAAIYGLEESGGVEGLVLELVPGETLAERLTKGPLPVDEALEIARQIAEALEAAHERGIVHRDLKPANVKLTPEGKVKVLDFGLAKAMESERPASDSSHAPTVTAGTAAGVVLGTAAYMSPEQARGKPVDKRTDVWAFGAVLYEMLTGRLAFGGETVSDSLAAVLTRDPDWSDLPAGVPPSLRLLLKRCLERETSKRLRDVGDARLAIEDIGAGVSPATGLPPIPPRIGRSRWLLPAVAFGGTALVAVLFLWKTAGSRQRRFGGDAPDAVIKSVVALPSKVLASEAERYLADAVPNTLSTQLTRVQGLETMAPPSSVEVARLGGDLDKLAEAYGVNAFVLSSVTAETGRLLLNVQLVEARSRRLLWSHDYEGNQGNFLELVRQSADGLREALRPAAAVEGLPPVNARATASSSDAELAYQRGLYFWNRFNNLHGTSDFDAALSAFQQALAQEPALAEAAARISWLYEFRMEAGGPAADNVPEMDTWARRALRIDTRNSLAWSAMVVLEQVQPRPSLRKALTAGLRCTAYDPQSSWAHNALSMAVWDTSLTLFQEAAHESARLDPLYLYARVNQAQALASLGRQEEALAAVDGALKLEPDMPVGLQNKLTVLINLGRTGEADALLKRLEVIAEQGRADPAMLKIQEAGLVLRKGAVGRDRSAANEALEAAWANPASPFADELSIPAWLTRADGAAAAIEATRRRLAAGHSIPYDLLMLHPDLSPMRRNPRFSEIARPSRARFDEMVSVLEEAKSQGELPGYLEKRLADLLARLGLRSAEVK